MIIIAMIILIQIIIIMTKKLTATLSYSNTDYINHNP